VNRTLLASCLFSLAAFAGCAHNELGPPGTELTTAGTIVSYTTDEAGDWNGFWLNTGTRIHFPPYAGSHARAVAVKGQFVNVEGVIRRRLDGDVLEAWDIFNLNNGRKLNVTGLLPPTHRTSP
jgi:hypothetical protein